MAKNKGRQGDEFTRFTRDEPREVPDAEAGQRFLDAEVPDPAAGEKSTSVVAEEPQVSTQEVNRGVDEAAVTFHTGRELPRVTPRDGVHPLLVESYKLLRTLVAGGLITPWAGTVMHDVDVLLARLRKEVEG